MWRGKDEQDQTNLAVEAQPIYIQEKSHPWAIIEDIRAHAGTNGNEPQAEFFADFNGLEFEELIDFYKHQQNWANRMVLGDSLQVSTRKCQVADSVEDASREPKVVKAFRDIWELGGIQETVKSSDQLRTEALRADETGRRSSISLLEASNKEAPDATRPFSDSF